MEESDSAFNKWGWRDITSRLMSHSTINYRPEGVHQTTRIKHFSEGINQSWQRIFHNIDRPRLSFPAAQPHLTQNTPLFHPRFIEPRSSITNQPQNPFSVNWAARQPPMYSKDQLSWLPPLLPNTPTPGFKRRKTNNFMFASDEVDSEEEEVNIHTIIICTKFRRTDH